jgi:ABC-type Zn uptake system ZnuABC Zn-binding protein ZnuA
MGAEEALPTVPESVSPLANAFGRGGGETVKFAAGSSRFRMHTYEPTPKQMVAADWKSDIWFKVGKFWNPRVKNIKRPSLKLKVVDLRDGLDMITTDPESGCRCHANSQDLHIWLSRLN